MRAGAKQSRKAVAVRVQLSARAFAWSAIAAGLMSVACDSKRLCDDGACDFTSRDATDGGFDASVKGDHSSRVDAAPAATVDSGSAADSGPDAPARPCQGDGGCPAGGVCHPEVNLCVACTSDEQCEAPAPFCVVDQNPAKNACVGCETNDDCGEGVCVDQRCVACNLGSNAGCEAPAAQCIEAPDASPRCVECAANEDCTDPQKPVCEPATGSCVVCAMDGAGCGESERCVESDLAVGVGESDAAPALARRCIECTPETAARDCRADTPYCVNDHCAVCDPELDQGCDGVTPYCRAGAELAEETGSSGLELGVAVCVECRSDGDCVVGGAFCVAGACEQCRVDTDCNDPAASSCDTASHECVPCASSGQCQHIAGAQVCHVEAPSDASPGGSRCVECDALDYRACDGAKDVCVTIPTTAQFTCSDRRVNQLGFCAECLADSDCSAQERCVAQESAASGQSGYYCTYLVGADGAPSSCSEASAEPFTRAVHATSIDGVIGTYCALDTTSCDVFNHFKQSCTVDTDCGEPQDGATCYPPGASGRCTYTCSGDPDCPQPGGDCVNGRCQTSSD